MPALTSPSGCVSCASLAVKILELEGRISTLYKIQEAEKYLDTIVFKPAQPDSSSGLEPDPTAVVPTSSPDPAFAAHSPARESTSPPEPVTAHGPTPPPFPIPDESWALFGAKPKGLVSSTPSQPWSRAGPSSRRGKSSPHPRPDFSLPLQNTFDILGMTDFPPLAAPPSSRLSYGSRRSPPARRRRTMPHFTPAPGRTRFPPVSPTSPGRPPSPTAAAHQRSGPPPCSSTDGCPEKLAGQLTEQHSRPPPRLSVGGHPATKGTEVPERNESADPVLVVGSSMVRHVRINKCRTSCHPGALVIDVRTSALRHLRHSPSISTVVINACSNDLKLELSEKLKVDFISLIDSVLNSNKQCVISGPIPSPRFGDVKYSRLRQLHIWLKDYCCNRGIPYVDNFTTFFKRPDLFKHDRLHLNYSGSRLLSTNIELTLHSCKAFFP